MKKALESSRHMVLLGRRGDVGGLAGDLSLGRPHDFQGDRLLIDMRGMVIAFAERVVQ